MSEKKVINTRWKAIWHKLFGCLMRECKRGGINTVDLYFGWTWGEQYLEKVFPKYPLEEVLIKISEVERLTGAHVEERELMVGIREVCEILFCHEDDIHLTYSNRSALLDEIEKVFLELGETPYVS